MPTIANSAIPATESVAFDTVQSVLRSTVSVLGYEHISLSDALGRVAAGNVVADEDLVPYERSAMDGYALRTSDTVSASPRSPVGIPIVGKVFAGDGKAASALP